MCIHGAIPAKPQQVGHVVNIIYLYINLKFHQKLTL